jgi:O-antigen ligase/tetratricopeptide (TPR) repeat protein
VNQTDTKTETILEPASETDRWLAPLILLPILVLAWPGPTNPIAGVFATTELSATGVALLFSLPAAFLGAWRRPRPHRVFLLLLLAWLALTLHPGNTDTLQTDRSWMGLLTGLTLAVAASTLREAGKNRLVRGMVLISILFLGRALLDPSGGWGGVLGNTGELSGAALPGALCGLFLWARCRSGWRWIGLLAVVLFLLHAFVAPVLAALLVLAVVAGAGLFLAWRTLERTARARLIMATALAGFGLAWTQLGPPIESPEENVAAAAAQPTTLGGVEVRFRIWAATLPMIADHPLTGVGAGQFAAAFPPYRDQREIELSTGHHESWRDPASQEKWNAEVEHPHNDWLSFFAEGGIAGGLAWCGFLLLVGIAAVRRLRGSTPIESALAAGALATILGALVNAPFTFNPAASAAGFVLFGTVLPAGRTSPRGRFGHLLAPALAIAALLYVPRALAMMELGSSMEDVAGTTSVTAQEIAVDDALDACPDSVVALTMKARILAERDGDRRGALGFWTRVLALRPHRLEALQASGVLQARLGEVNDAGSLFDAALAVDGGHPGLIRNRIYNFAERGLIEKALAEVDRLGTTGHYRSIDLLNQACKLIIRGQDREGLRLLARVDARFEDMTAELAWALDAEYRTSGSPLVADAFKALAHVLWGREHAAAGQWDDARRSYRQNLRIVRDYIPGPYPVRLRMEFAAVLLKSRQPEDAQTLLEGLKPRPHDWVAMPEWAGQILFDNGLGSDG